MQIDNIKIGRGQFGQIISRVDGDDAPASYRNACDILAQAIRQGKIEAPYVDVDSKHRGTALNYDVYDFARGQVLVQQRLTTCTKYGNSPKKSYLMLRRQGGKVVVDTSTDAYKARIAKLAKSGLPWGGVIAAITGKKPAKIKAPALTWTTAYKALAIIDGDLESIYNGETYTLGQMMRERVQDDHRGGYYSYRTAGEAAEAVFPDDSVNLDEPRVIVRCEIAGRKLRYGGGKIASTYLRPVEIIASSIDCRETVSA